MSLKGVFNGYTGQLHVSLYTGHLQVVLRELKVLLYTLSAHVVQYYLGCLSSFDYERNARDSNSKM